MKRSAFTMIELIFGIVIMGILAAVALPRFAGVQDDALVATEKAGIGSIRASLQAIRGHAITRASADINQSIFDDAGTKYYVWLKKVGTSATTNYSNKDYLSRSNYPNALSTEQFTGTADSTILPAFLGSNTDPKYGPSTLAMVLEPGGRDSWVTSDTELVSGTASATTVQDTEGKKSYLQGPAMRGVTDEQAEYNDKMNWEYNSYAGTMTANK